MKTWLFALILILGSANLAAAQTINEGTELLLTNSRSDVFLGYGVVEQGQLKLLISEEVRRFVMLFIQASGEIESFSGEITAAGRLQISLPSGELVDFQDLLLKANISLDLSFAGEDDSQDEAEDDNHGPGEDSGDNSDDKGDGDGGGNEDDSGADDDEDGGDSGDDEGSSGGGEDDSEDD